jgi:hypothetical protein
MMGVCEVVRETGEKPLRSMDNDGKTWRLGERA